ncbi:hypothetical protein [Streptomyces paludis]|uniref:Uncharacterized protein n=1 Tax=Streptomyces paludis TaxID=2282738 RepID=A0A345HWS5_9ACTN|nr:hypothetical protein [Streptomyces paludis]AXG81149.1 hypothetical protein DVK44_29555 [Streptomyces paludis]
MSTPIEQIVPADFQDVLDLPGSGGGPWDLKKSQRTVDYSKKQAADAMAAYNKAKAEAAAQMKKYKAKGATKAQKAAATKARALALATMARQTTIRNAALKKQGAAQNEVWKANGQFDKLLSGANRDAFLALQSMFKQMGLGSLAGKIYEFAKQGYGADTISLLLQDTKEYKERFKANEARAKAGLAVLSPAEYLAAEAAYRQILSSAGMPKGFYDNPADFRGWIAGDVSPAEIKSRVDMATEAVNKVDPNYRGALFQMYGINSSELAAYFLDRKVAEPILKKQAAAGAIGAAALRRGFSLNALDLESYASLGISGEEAEAAYGQIAGSFESMLGLAGRYGSTWTQRDAEQEVFTPGVAGSISAESAAEKGKRLKSAERAQFSGARGASSGGLAAGFRQT